MASNGNGQYSNDVVILGAARTPQGKLLGELANLSAVQLGQYAVQAAVERSGVNPTDVNEVIIGQVLSAGAGQAVPRQIWIGAGFPETVGGITVNKVCGSGLKAVMLGASAIRAGDGDVYVAGGTESMTNTPFLSLHQRTGHKYGNIELKDGILQDGLWCSIEGWVMGDAAEFIGDQFEVTREEMDEFAVRSHQLAHKATVEGYFEREIVPLEIQERRSTRVVKTDEPIRSDTSLEALAKLRPAFKPDGRVTAGNAPGLNDGAAALVIASRHYSETHGHQPIARIVSYAHAAVEPKWIFYAPVKAIPLALQKAGWTMDDVDLFEINEAFAAQVLADIRGLEREGYHLPLEKLNVHGGAIALGHPLGASGARVLVTLIHALQQHGLKRGLAALCLGGGEAVAMTVELE
ncbi:MAG: acetyl-CoA C-acyltransferase [Phototrophicales bacterium]|nr:MAG: acetyl-CoA C-acyltransferase [Phototrophicales bacterium]